MLMAGSAPKIKKPKPLPPSMNPSVPLKDGKNRLILLPAEIRNTIYEMTLVTTANIEIHQQSKHGEDEDSDYNRISAGSKAPKTLRWKEPALLQTSKQIRIECASIYYLGNTFKFFAFPTEFEDVLKFLQRKSSMIGKANGEKIVLTHKIRALRPNWFTVIEWWQIAVIAYSSEGAAGPIVDSIKTYQGPASAEVALEELVRMALKVRDRGLKMDDFRYDFADWVVGKASMVESRARDRIEDMVKVWARDMGLDKKASHLMHTFRGEQK